MQLKTFAAGAGFLLLVGCGGGGNGTGTGPPTAPPTTPPPGAPPPNTIFIDAAAFVPGSMTIASGTTITFTIRQGPPHDVTWSQNPPVQGNVPLSNAGSFERTFQTQGESHFRCAFHGFTGMITVQ